MTQVVDVDVIIHGKTYTIACPRGQEARLRTLSEFADERIVKLSRQVGKKMVLSENKLLVMGILMLVDEMFEEKNKSNEPPTSSAKISEDNDFNHDAIDVKYASKIKSLTEKINTMSDKLAVNDGE